MAMYAITRILTLLTPNYVTSLSHVIPNGLNQYIGLSESCDPGSATNTFHFSYSMAHHLNSIIPPLQSRLSFMFTPYPCILPQHPRL